MIANFEVKMAAPDFWDDNDKAQGVIAEMNAVKSSVDSYEQLRQEYEDAGMMAELADEEGDETLAGEIENSVTSLLSKLQEFELQLLLNQPYDKLNAILELHPGAGGTESQDWGQMLLRMYTRWAEKRGFKVETLDYLAGDEAGIKSVTLLIKGYNAYGYLKAEKGVHRLVRISPLIPPAVVIHRSYPVMWCRKLRMMWTLRSARKILKLIRTGPVVRAVSILIRPIQPFGLRIYLPVLS